MDEKIYSERDCLEMLLELSEELEVSQLDLARAYASKNDALDEFDNICAQAPRGPHDFGEIVEKAVRTHQDSEGHKENVSPLAEIVDADERVSQSIVAQGSIDDIVKPSTPRILYELGKRTLFGGAKALYHAAKWSAKTAVTFAYYATVGALPGKYQEKIAERTGKHEKMKYLVANGIAEVAILSIGMYYLGTYLTVPAEQVPVGIVFALTGATVGGVTIFIRAISGTDYDRSYVGSPFLTAPYYTVRLLGKGGKKVTSSISHGYEWAASSLSGAYQKAEQDLMTKALPAPQVRVEVPEEGEKLYVGAHSEDSKKGNTNLA